MSMYLKDPKSPIGVRRTDEFEFTKQQKARIETLVRRHGKRMPPEAIATGEEHEAYQLKTTLLALDAQMTAVRRR